MKTFVNFWVSVEQATAFMCLVGGCSGGLAACEYRRCDSTSLGLDANGVRAGLLFESDEQGRGGYNDSD